MATVKDCHALTTYYEKVFKSKYGTRPVVNRNTARWSWDGMLHGLPVEEIKSLIDYYFTTPTNNKHSLQWFFLNYEKLIEGRQAVLEDRSRREILRRESEERAKKWREKFGNQGIAGNQLSSEE